MSKILISDKLIVIDSLKDHGKKYIYRYKISMKNEIKDNSI